MGQSTWGEFQKTFSKKSITVKLFAMLSVASASTTSWIVDHWWGNAIKVYNYVSDNRDSFASVVDAAPDASFTPLYTNCGGADGALSADDLINCGKNIRDSLDMGEATGNYLYEFAAKYFDVVDTNKSGDLDFSEFKYAMAGFAATNALTILDGFDTDKNGALTGDEINAYYAEAVRIANSWGYKVTDGQWAALKTAYGQYMADGRLSMVDLARFEMDAANVFPQLSCIQLILSCPVRSVKTFPEIL